MELGQTGQTATPTEQIDTQLRRSNALAPIGLTQTHYLVAHKLAQGRSRASVCRSLSLQPYHIKRFFENPDFTALLEQLQDDYSARTTLPLEEMQRRINEEALTSIETAADIRDGEFGDAKDAAVRLRAANLLLDRASNVPKAAKGDESAAAHDVFNQSFIQILVETARQVGDKTIFAAANKALKEIPSFEPSTPVPDSPPVKTLTLGPISSSTHIQTLDEVLSSLSQEEEYE